MIKVIRKIEDLKKIVLWLHNGNLLNYEWLINCVHDLFDISEHEDEWVKANKKLWAFLEHQSEMEDEEYKAKSRVFQEEGLYMLEWVKLPVYMEIESVGYMDRESVGVAFFDKDEIELNDESLEELKELILDGEEDE